MPVKWTAERNQTLLILVLQLSQGTLDYRTIADNWPESAGDKPTPKALTEHIAKIKKGMQESPQKPKAAAPKNKVTKSRAKKAKKVVVTDDDDEEQEQEEDLGMEIEEEDVQKVKKKLFGQEIKVEEQEETV